VNGLEILLFGVFLIFVLANLLIRFLVRKTKSIRRAAGEETEVQERPPETSATGLFSPVREIGDDVIGGEDLMGETMRVSGVRAPMEETQEAAALFDKEKKQPGVGSGMEEHTRRFRGTIEAKKETQIQKETFWERVDTLPPLQRAIVLSEVLGPSKGIDS
jgi:hypothetical protein